MNLTREGTTVIATSLEAREVIRPHLKRLRATVYCMIQGAGDRGLTADEILVALEDEMPGIGHQSISQRPGELAKLGLIYDSGMRRPTRRGCMATVWRTNPFNHIV